MNWLDVLSPEARSLASMWAAPCDDALEALATFYPADLLRLCAADVLRPGSLTYAAEAAGAIADGDAVRAALVPLLDHASPMVREGAVYGLRDHHDASTLDRIARLATSDSIEEIRHLATAELTTSSEPKETTR